MLRSLPLLLVALMLAPLAARAQAPEEPQPQKEHQLLQRFVGQWDSEGEAVAGPDMPAVKCKGSMTARMLGGFWVVSDLAGDVPGGGKMTALQTIGYDPEKKKHVGTWIDSMMNHLWTYEGSYDEASKLLTLNAEGPSVLDPTKTSQYRDSYEFASADHIIVRSSMQIDGQWVTFMTGHLRRKKIAR